MRARPYRRRTDADERVQSAKTAIRTLLASREQILDEQLRELLSVCVWKLTEADCDHKHRTRYRSKAALTAPLRELRHEHVFERSDLVERMLANAKDSDRIADSALACTVTREEHVRLTNVSREQPGLQGWARYSAAGVEVVDTLENIEHRTA